MSIWDWLLVADVVFLAFVFIGLPMLRVWCDRKVSGSENTGAGPAEGSRAAKATRLGFGRGSRTSQTATARTSAIAPKDDSLTASQSEGV